MGIDEFFSPNDVSPADLPTTWGDARLQFRDLCETQGYQEQSCSSAELLTFEGYPTGSEEMIEDPEFSGRLQVLASTVGRMDDISTDDDEHTAGEKETALLAKVESNMKLVGTEKAASLEGSLQTKGGRRRRSGYIK